MHTLEGTWYSHYEYEQGPSNKPSFNDHVMQFSRVDHKWLGVSLPNKEGSEVSLTLRQLRVRNQQFVGEWHVRTSSTGYYGGYKFNGLVLLLISEDGQELKGEWISATRTSGKVKHGLWTLQRETSPFGRLQLLIDSHPDLKHDVNEQFSVLVDKPSKDKSGKVAEGYVNLGATVGVCFIAFIKGYHKRTPEENSHILAAADQLLLEFNDEHGLGYDVGMSFGESFAYAIHNGEIPLSVDDLASYPNLHKEVKITTTHLKA